LPNRISKENEESKTQGCFFFEQECRGASTSRIWSELVNEIKEEPYHEEKKHQNVGVEKKGGMKNLPAPRAFQVIN